MMTIKVKKKMYQGMMTEFVYRQWHVEFSRGLGNTHTWSLRPFKGSSFGVVGVMPGVRRPYIDLAILVANSVATRSERGMTSSG